MKKSVKKYMGVALVGLMLAMSASKVMAAAGDEAVNPRGAGGVGFFNPSFLGLQVMKIEGTVAPYQIVLNDSGLLYAVCRQDETADTYAMAFDYTTGLSPLISYVNINGAGKEADSNKSTAITPYVYSSGSTLLGYHAEAQWGCWVPPWPARFDDGLVGVNDGAAGFSLFYYRTDDGTNPYLLKGG